MFRKCLNTFSRILRRCREDRRGSTALVFAAAAPLLMGGAYVAIELSQINTGQAKLQGIADQAAIAAAREMRLGNSTKETVLSVAKAVAAAGEGALGIAIKFDGEVPDAKSWVRVTLRAKVQQSLAPALGLTGSTFSANATAKVLGGSPVCALALRESALPGITLDAAAKMEARNCAVYSNSRYQSSIWIRDKASLSAALICAGGGVGAGTGQITPEPTTDCPKLDDPLANRPPPPVEACAVTGMVIKEESKTLMPGTYCGGLTITGGSDVALSPGVYVIKDGPLVVNGGSTLKGVYTGLYFTGTGAEMTFEKDTMISLTAPKTGPMAGLLIFQDRNILAAQAVSKLGSMVARFSKDETDAVKPLKYEVSSDNASTVLGTIYLPKGRFYSGGANPIGAQSAYTIIVAYQINAESGPTLVLNSNYNMTDVPVPNGLGNLSNKVMLDR